MEYLNKRISTEEKCIAVSHTDALNEVVHEFSVACWRNTSSFTSINTFITMNYAGLRDDIMTMLAGGKVMVNTNTYQN